MRYAIYMLLVALVVTSCRADRNEAPPRVAAVTTPTPASYEVGEKSFETYCAGCHGVRAVGTGNGPPLVHQLYEPSHHADQAFYRAAQFGVRPHHWGFGKMPPVKGVSREELTGIISYVRWLQRESGIY